MLIAHHLGGVGPNESLAEGTARGLGYEKGLDLRKALGSDTGTPNREYLNARWRDAVDRLFTLRGLSLECGDRPLWLQEHPPAKPGDAYLTLDSGD